MAGRKLRDQNRSISHGVQTRSMTPLVADRQAREKYDRWCAELGDLRAGRLPPCDLVVDFASDDPEKSAPPLARWQSKCRGCGAVLFGRGLRWKCADCQQARKNARNRERYRTDPAYRADQQLAARIRKKLRGQTAHELGKCEGCGVALSGSRWKCAQCTHARQNEHRRERYATDAVYREHQKKRKRPHSTRRNIQRRAVISALRGMGLVVAEDFYIPKNQPGRWTECTRRERAIIVALREKGWLDENYEIIVDPTTLVERK